MDSQILGYGDISTGPSVRQLSLNADPQEVDRCIELLSQVS